MHILLSIDYSVCLSVCLSQATSSGVYHWLYFSKKLNVRTTVGYSREIWTSDELGARKICRHLQLRQLLLMTSHYIFGNIRYKYALDTVHWTWFAMNDSYWNDTLNITGWIPTWFCRPTTLMPCLLTETVTRLSGFGTNCTLPSSCGKKEDTVTYPQSWQCDIEGRTVQTHSKLSLQNLLLFNRIYIINVKIYSHINTCYMTNTQQFVTLKCQFVITISGSNRYHIVQN